MGVLGRKLGERAEETWGARACCGDGDVGGWTRNRNIGNWNIGDWDIGDWGTWGTGEHGLTAKWES